MKTKLIILALVMACVFPGVSQKKQDNPIKTEYRLEEKIPYRDALKENLDDYAVKNCQLDLYYPVNKKGFATVVWFHGGGLSGGNKEIPEILKNQGYAVVGVEYRKNPQVKCPVYIEDAAASVAWVFEHIER